MRIKKNDINLYDTLFSGQCFRMKQEADNSYTFIISDRVINLKEYEEYLEVYSSKEEDLDLVIDSYFDNRRNYEELNKLLCKNKIIKNNIELCKGYRILKQDKFEMFITYIISQNNNVKRISKIVEEISRRYGKKVIFRNQEYYLFPTYNELKDITIEELRSIGLGFRDKYIKNALDKIKEDSMFLEKLDFMSTPEAIKTLMTIKGIGLKVASCIMLFAYGRFDTFPIDTWVRKFVSNNFDLKNDVTVIKTFMEKEFADNSGLAIQYFYHIERNKKQVRI